MAAVTTQSAPSRTMQGIAVPSESVNPDLFFALTRRHQTAEKSLTYGGGGVSQVVELRKADILSTIALRFVGTVTVTGGTTNSTAAWPLSMAGVRFSANGASNLINTGPVSSAGGGGLAHLRVRDYMKRADLTDRGVTQTIGGVSKSSGTLALSSENWGVGSATTGIAAGTYNVDLVWTIPVAEDERDLVGAIFLQTSTADLTLVIDETPVSTLFSGGTATSVTVAGTWQVSTTKFSIPVGPSGQIVIPNLSMFHSIIASSTSQLSNGENEPRIVGQGAGKSLLRVFGRVLNGAGSAAAPLVVNDTNYGQLGWRYGNNETPDLFSSGQVMRTDCERRYNVDVGAIHGYWCHDFAAENAFRDVVDMGTTSELRLLVNLPSALTLTSPALQYVTETAFLAS